MKLRFSDRIGKTKVRTEIFKEGLTSEMDNILWTLILDLIIETKSNSARTGHKHSKLTSFYRNIWIHFFKRPVDNLPMSYSQVNGDIAKTVLRDWYYNAKWYEKLNLLEFCSEDEDDRFHEVR